MSETFNPHQGVGQTQAVEWADDGESTPATPTERVKAVREANPAPVEDEPGEEAVAPAEEDLLPSEQTPDANAPATEGDASDAAPAKDTAAEVPETPAGHAKRYAEKFETPEDLESGYRNLQTLKGRLDSQLAQSQHQVTQLQEQLAQMQRVNARAPRFEELSPDVQSRLAAEALEEDPYLRDSPEEWHKRCSDLAKQEWKAEQAALRLVEHGSKQALQNQRAEALQSVVEYGSKLEKHGPHVLAKFGEHPEVFEVMRQMEPRALDKFGKRYLDLLAVEAEMQTLRSQQPDRDAAMRQAGRKESLSTEARKDAAGSVASKATTVKTAPPPAKPAATTSKGTLARLLESAAKPAPGDLWE